MKCKVPGCKGLAITTAGFCFDHRDHMSKKSLLKLEQDAKKGRNVLFNV